MKLRELMDRAFDETWFCIVTPDGEEHYVWNADYLGGYEPTLEELEPLLDREFDEFELVVRDNPEAEDVANADKVPMVWVGVLKTDEELKEEEIAAKRAEQKAKKKKRDSFMYLKRLVPSNAILFFMDKGQATVYGADAMEVCIKFARNGGIGYMPGDSWLWVPLSDFKKVAAKMIKAGRVVAIGEKAAEPTKRCSWVISALIDRLDDLKSWEKSRVG